MLEQSQKNAPVYRALETIEKGKKKLATKTLNIPDIKFGMPHRIQIHINPETTAVMVAYIDEPQPNGYVYQNGTLIATVESYTQPKDVLHDYNYGVAQIGTSTDPYFIVNEPSVSYDGELDRQTFKLPPTIAGYPYDQTFSYLPELNEFLGTLPATFTDRYKRPLNARAMAQGKYFPTSFDKVTTTFSDLSNTNQPFPIVVDLSQTVGENKYAAVDLEPGYTDSDLSIAASFDALYAEDTPRGGKHYLVRVSPENTAFGYRISPYLEVEVQRPVTLYGINGELRDKKSPLIDFSEYNEIGHDSNPDIKIEIPAHLSELIERVEQRSQSLGLTGKTQAKRVYLIDKDESHADYMAMLKLYMNDVMPYGGDISESDLPWVLAGYAEGIIPSRAKHSSQRNGVPYLVYVADKIIRRNPVVKTY